MNFADLQERLRLELVRRIEADTLTGSRLAQQTGFRQAHISNFLNRKRALSLEGLDRVLAAQNLTVDKILPASPIALDASASTLDSLVESVPLVSPTSAMDEASIEPTSVIEHISVSAPLLHENRPRSSPGQTRWRRFVALRAEVQQAEAMHPLIVPGSILILDRHYTSLALYRSHQPNLYAARCGSSLQLGFVSFDDGRLILRPSSTAFPVQLIPVPQGKSPSDLIVGRVCLVFNEL